MLDIILYALGVMYTPGPVNTIALNAGIQNKKNTYGFFFGIATAIFILFLLCSYVGQIIATKELLSIFSIIGALYIIWIAYKINNSNPEISSSEDKQELTFTDGLLMQLMNPKGITVALPIAAVQFPTLHITGLSIVIWCALLAIISFGAPLSYSVLGIYLGEKIKNPIYFKILNKVMAVFLLIVAIKMLVAEFL
jgi:threonine/homoserine/homoserine lactone efflux protein